MEKINLVKSSLTHISQNPNPIPPKRVLNKLPDRQRKLPVTISDDFLW
jgi:hypothetical protein